MCIAPDLGPKNRLNYIIREFISFSLEGYSVKTRSNKLDVFGIAATFVAM